MRNFWIILSHTFWTHLRSKTFLWSTAIICLILFLILKLPSIIAYFEEREGPDRIGIVDRTGKVAAPLQNTLAQLYGGEIELVEAEDEATAVKRMEEEKWEAYLLIDEVNQGLISATYKAESLNQTGLITRIQQALEHLQRHFVTQELELTDAEIQRLNQPVQLHKVALDPEAKSESEMIVATGLVYVLIMIIYFAVLTFGTMVALEVAREKSSRVMEILISSAHPVAHMFGKIIGIGLLGICQYATLILVGTISLRMGGERLSLGPFAIDLSQIPADLLIYGVIYFILGYFLYATLAAMLGSLARQVEEANQILTPLTLLQVVAFMLSMYGLSNPELSIIRAASYIPFFTPMLMFLRLGLTDLPDWEILLSFAILLVSIVGAAYLGASVYRGGVLMYGKGFSYKDIRKALTFQKDA